MTKDQFINQELFWQDKYYSYALHITDGGAKYLWQVDGTRLTKKELEYIKFIRLDGVDIDKLCEKLQESKNIKCWE